MRLLSVNFGVGVTRVFCEGDGLLSWRKLSSSLGDNLPQHFVSFFGNCIEARIIVDLRISSRQVSPNPTIVEHRQQ
jgi:hypothetical protein